MVAAGAALPVCVGAAAPGGGVTMSGSLGGATLGVSVFDAAATAATEPGPAAGLMGEVFPATSALVGASDGDAAGV